MKYNDSLFSYKRVLTKAVSVGNLIIGNGNPIRIQSMTNTDTNNVDATVDQILELEDAGCEIVRITVPSVKAADSTELIVNKLKQKNSKVPLVADIHFTPNAAMKVIDFVEKVRINPGNYVDKKKFEVYSYSDEEYLSEMHRIEDKFSPLVEKAIKLNRALRIGTNHGSLSDRIMNRFGDSPEGMVESAWEFAAICQKMDFHNFVFSMKASNTQVMIQAYRLLQNRMFKEDTIYPLHLGVTEAGDGIDGRIKSFIGIGSLLDDGLGDTIRVSLTESPVKEVPVARQLADFYNKKQNEERLDYFERRDPIHFQKRETIAAGDIGADHVCHVILDTDKALKHYSENDLRQLKVFDLQSSVEADKYILTIEDELDISHLKDILKKNILSDQKIILHCKIELNDFDTLLHMQTLTIDTNKDKIFKNTKILAFDFKDASLNDIHIYLNTLKLEENIALTVSGNGSVYKYRLLAELFPNNALLFNGNDLSKDEALYQLMLSIQSGSLLCDGIGNGIIMSSKFDSLENIKLAFTILQGSRTRISKTEYISCPSCGRTLFDLEETTALIKSHTSHLVGVKIAVMGCIVNGPGEMADADFGYVGSGPGKINLYVGQDLVKRNIASASAVQELIDLIKSKEMWVEASE